MPEVGAPGNGRSGAPRRFPGRGVPRDPGPFAPRDLRGVGVAPRWSRPGPVETLAGLPSRERRVRCRRRRDVVSLGASGSAPPEPRRVASASPSSRASAVPSAALRDGPPFPGRHGAHGGL